MKLPSRTFAALGLSALLSISAASMASAADDIIGKTVRFTSENTSVDVTISADTPAVRDFLSMLPMNLELEEYAGREKIGYLPRKLELNGTKGFDPEDGDLIYFVPWGNLGFYYNAEGADYSDQTLEIGTYDASLEKLTELEGDVKIEFLD